MFQYVHIQFERNEEAKFLDSRLYDECLNTWLHMMIFKPKLNILYCLAHNCMHLYLTICQHIGL